MSELASLNLKLPSTLKNDFTQTAEALGMPAATALKVLITRFVEVGGFPFDVRIQRRALTGMILASLEPTIKMGN